LTKNTRHGIIYVCFGVREEDVARQKKSSLLVQEIVEGSRYRVHSSSGNAYTVRYCGSGDADPDYVATWECSCPAYKYRRGKICKHIEAVINYNDPRYDED
jgi:hypothetical protein